MIQPFSCYSPPTEGWAHKVLLVGEAPGEEEVEAGNKPFVGPAGRLLNRLLNDAGLRREQLHLTNVFSERPPRNDLLQWSTTKTEIKKLDRNYATPKMPSGKYLLPQYLPHLGRLQHEISELGPDLIIGLGAVALWALTGDSKIGNSRGAFIELPTCPSLFTFHPANILRQYENYALAWRDLVKARKALNGELSPPLVRRLCINPTFEEMEEYYERFASNPFDTIGVDIETRPAAGQLTCIAFALPQDAICIPIWNPDTTPERCNVYPTARDEATAIGWIMRFGQLPNPKVLQNGLYDMQWLLDWLDIRLKNVYDDTAILQHVIQPELPKALGTLASLYLNEPLWKYMRTSVKDVNKADE